MQAWYNQWIQPDPTRADSNGVPTRLLFGLEEVWENRLADNNRPADGPTDFKVIASYTGGTGCLFLILSFPACPTAAGYGGTTLHPDHHAGLFVPDGKAVSRCTRAMTAASACSTWLRASRSRMAAGAAT